MIEKVISGGQTGADLAGLKVARAAGIPTGGYACRGRKVKAPDGRTDVAAPWLADFGLIECERPGYPARTRANVMAADFTLVFIDGVAGPGTKLTLDLLRRLGRPFIVVIREASTMEMPDTVARVLARRDVKVLNVAGVRETLPPRVGEWVERYLSEVFRLLKGENTP